MKAILISIKPEYVAKILNKEMTICVRKTMPKCDLPIDVYIYCSKTNKHHWYLQERYDHSTDETLGHSTPYYTYMKVGEIMTPQLDSKVVAKFTLNKVEEIRFYDKEVQRKACLTENELFDYLFVNEPYHEDMKKGYAWHIDNLVIFDNPKELNEFYTVNKYGIPQYEFGLGTCDYRRPKAPITWSYVEVEK